MYDIQETFLRVTEPKRSTMENLSKYSLFLKLAYSSNIDKCSFYTFIFICYLFNFITFILCISDNTSFVRVLCILNQARIQLN